MFEVLSSHLIIIILKAGYTKKPLTALKSSMFYYMFLGRLSDRNTGSKYSEVIRSEVIKTK